MAGGLGVLVLLGWSATASAEATEPSPSLDGPAVHVAVERPAETSVRPTPAAPRAGLAPVTELLTPLTHGLGATLGTATAPVTTAAAPVLAPVATAVAPVVHTVEQVVEPLAPVLAPVTTALEPVLAPVIDQVLVPVVDDVVAPVLAPTLEPVAEALAPARPTAVLGDALDPIVAPVLGTPADDGDIEIIDAIDIDRDPAPLAVTPATTAPDASLTAVPNPTAAPAVLAVAGTDALDAPTATATDQATSAGTNLSDGPTAPSTPAPVAPSSCTAPHGSTVAAPVLSIPASAGDPTASSRRISAPPAGDDRPSGRPQPQPGFAPD